MSMPFSTNEKLEQSKKFLESVEKPACSGCVRGIRMCYHTPCIGTADDIEKLLDAGYAKNLMLDYWSGRSTIEEGASKAFKKEIKPKDPNSVSTYFEDDVMYLVPATIGNEGKVSGYNKGGQCNLLVDNKCSLHTLGLKPTQGQFACCKVERVYLDEFGKQRELDERLPILNTWNTQKGKDLIERWKKEVGHVGVDKAEFPNDPGSMITFLFEALSAHENSAKRAKEGGCPDIPEYEKENQVYTVTYEKPY